MKIEPPKLSLLFYLSDCVKFRIRFSVGFRDRVRVSIGFRLRVRIGFRVRVRVSLYLLSSEIALKQE